MNDNLKKKEKTSSRRNISINLEKKAWVQNKTVCGIDLSIQIGDGRASCV